ncbi:S-layer homology domain-containing protein [Sedimentibacter sp.]|uniref:S-layer homology domain-containing protein n=1 Tax=Sedimentibacter sp. TaxID=1960295 RepID=UPI0028AFA72F|nr:S-layer homology domain-containing protein [Sedimentibacter sp.]
MTGDLSCGVSVRNQNESKVTLNGNVEVTGDGAYGIDASFGEVTVNGNVTVKENFAIGVISNDFGSVKINGNVSATGNGATGINANMGEGAGGIVHVTGSVNVSSSDDDSIGIRCYSRETVDDKSMVTVDGKINADDIYILIDDIIRTSDSKDNIESGYWVYNGRHGSIVKISNSEVVTPVNAPTVVTNAVAGITTSSAILSGNVTSDGGDTVTERGFLFGTASNLTTYTAIKVGSGTGSFTTPITGLEENKTYYVRAYAVNSKGTGYGAIVSFTASDTPVNPPSPGRSSRVLSVPTVVTKGVSDITESKASLSGSVTSDGGLTVTERGFVYGKKANPSIVSSEVLKVSSGKGTGSFTSLVEELKAGTTYHVRAYAVNSMGTSYGEDMSFTTKKALVPAAGEIGWLDASGIDLSNPYGNVVLYTDNDGVQHILGLGIILGDRMKYVSRGQGKYEIIYNAKPFEDIAGHWAKNDIDFSSSRLLFNGISTRIFSPDTHMTRGMFAAVLGRMYGADPDYYMGYSFEDVPQDAYYAPYVKWAAESGVILGVSRNSFEPERAVTRQEMAAMMFRFMNYLGLKFTEDNNEFSDDTLIDSWARESIMQLKGTGIISGRTDNKFDPYGVSTRAEVAAVLRRLIEYILK